MSIYAIVSLIKCQENRNHYSFAHKTNSNSLAINVEPVFYNQLEIVVT
jgi:hypothetical protein